MVRKIIAVLLYVGAAVFLILAGITYANQQAEVKQFDELSALKDENVKQTIVKVEDKRDPDEVVEEYVSPLIDFTTLKEVNSDIVGWLSVEDSLIDYPIVHTPNNIEYYLRRDIEKKYSISGVPFIGVGSSLEPLADNLLIYGHNMDNDTMFGSLENYFDSEYLESHKFIEVYSEGVLYTYEVIALFVEDVTVGNGHFEYYNYLNWETRSVEEYSNTLSRMSSIPLEVPLTAEDDIITLSTCSYQSQHARTVVIGKLIETFTEEE